MAHLWVRDTTTEEDWVVAPLTAEAVTLMTEPPYVAPRPPMEGEIGVMRATPKYGAVEAEPQWVVLVADAARARVNGLALAGGIKVLDDRDEIRGAGVGRYFFSTERLASVTSSPGAEEPMFCPRCKLPIEGATEAVCCPVCGVWHHQEEGRLCWSYSEECAVCRHDTDLDRGYRWSPEVL